MLCFLFGSKRDFGLLMDDGFNGQIVSYGCRISSSLVLIVSVVRAGYLLISRSHLKNKKHCASEDVYYQVE